MSDEAGGCNQKPLIGARASALPKNLILGLIVECDYIICELRPQYLMSIIFTKNDKKKSTVGTYKGVFECK